MPGFDGTGPHGQGPMTGGRRGYCAVAIDPAGNGPTAQYGSFNRGRGRGFRNCYFATGLPGWMRAQRGMRKFGGYGRSLSKEEEISILKERSEILKEQLEDTNSQIREMESKKQSS